MEYHKDLKPKSGRLIQTKGPRDYQRAQGDDALVAELRRQIDGLECKLKSVDNGKQFTAEQMDDEIRAAAKAAIAETVVKYEGKIEEIERVLRAAEEKLALKNEIIEILKSKTTLKEEDFVIENGRPKMKNVFVDPLELGSGNELESHIKVRGVSDLKKEEVDDKIKKLKNLVGGFGK